jgi:regulator of replication initiation timing
MKLKTKVSKRILPYVIAIPTYARSSIIFKRTLDTLYKSNIDSKLIYLFLASNNEYKDYLNIFKTLKTETKIYYSWLSELKCVIGFKGLKNQRNFISDFFVEGQYIIQMDDDIQDFYYLNYDIKDIKNRKKWTLDSFKNIVNYIPRITNVKKTKNIKNPKYNSLTKTKKQKNKLKQKQKYIVDIENKKQSLGQLFIDTFKKCNEESINLWGIYPVENAWFMSPKETTDLRFIVGPCFGIINRHDSRLKLTLDEKENVERTLQYWSLDGKVLRLNNITLRTQYYKTPGGMQHSLERRDARKVHAMKSAEILHKRYPKLTKIYLGKKSGHPEIKLINIPRN